jgi:(1->4)-alpha-D-glucan 1-alpha-D-glucosylmutase
MVPKLTLASMNSTAAIWGAALIGPKTMNATATHDTKRSEDVRTRINVLSEMPHEWACCLRRWVRLNPWDGVPAPNEQVLIFQSMLGAWPIEADRLKPYVTKALREGKTHTSWINIDKDYERGVLRFVDSLYANRVFLKDFGRFQTKIAYYGALSSIAQLVIKITAPGIPDFYRGTEVWDLSLVDPDNRRPVAFSSRIEMLEELKKHSNPRELLKHWTDGRLKLYVTWKLLNFRREHSNLFLHGEYIPLRVAGSRADHVIAFARRLHSDWCVIAVPRLLAKLGRGKRLWQDTSIEMPLETPSHWVNILTMEKVSTRSSVSEVFATLPFAVLAPTRKVALRPESHAPKGHQCICRRGNPQGPGGKTCRK